MTFIKRFRKEYGFLLQKTLRRFFSRASNETIIYIVPVVGFYWDIVEKKEEVEMKEDVE